MAATLTDFYQNKKVLITGGSSGIGLALASLLIQHQAKVCILARTPENLQKAVCELENTHPSPDVEISSLTADVSDSANLNQALSTLLSRWGKVDILINSAGVAHPGEFWQLEEKIFHHMMQINYFGTVNAIRAVLPEMLTEKNGIIVNMSSVVGYMNIYGYTAYGASKYAVTGLSDALRMELKPHGIQVSLVYPPDTDTPQLAYENQYKPYVTKVLASSGGILKPDQVAREILIGVARRKYIILPGFENKLIYFAFRLLGKGLTYALMDRMVASALQRKTTAKK
ncbi:SDR family oxidoreductase [Bellilinea sp.]|jgi:3-dehydrosphinganine reductase